MIRALALLLFAALPARAAEDATLEAQQIAKTSSGVLCRYKVTNRRASFIDQFTINFAKAPAGVMGFGAGPKGPSGWHTIRDMCDVLTWVGDAPDIGLEPGEATEVEEEVEPPRKRFHCSDATLQIHTRDRRPPRVDPTRITLGIRGAKAFPSRYAWGERTRVEATLSVHNDGPADARFFFGALCGRPTQDLLQLIAVDEAGHETELTPAPVLLHCLSSCSGDVGEIQLKRDESFSGAVTRFAALQPGKYRLLVRYQPDAEGGERLWRPIRAPGWIWHGSAESEPVELVVP